MLFVRTPFRLWPRITEMFNTMSDSQNNSFQEIADVLREHQTFILMSHVRPDGDAIGSQLALGHALEQIGKTVYYRNEDGTPENLEFLPYSENVKQPQGEILDVDVAIALDCATKPRLGDQSNLAASKAKIWINIDHHISNPRYGDLNYIDAESPATGQILYEFLNDQDFPISDVTRDNIYVAVSTDTGSFQYGSTTAATYEMAAEMVKRGLNVGQINRLTYDSHPFRRVELMRELLNTLELSCDERVADWTQLWSVREKLELKPEDNEGLIDIIRAIKGIEIAVLFEELEGGAVRVSMRSKSAGIDVCEIAKVFGGGGHSKAAGIRMAGPIGEARRLVLVEVERVLA